jgi:host factor-I protein
MASDIPSSNRPSSRSDRASSRSPDRASSRRRQTPSESTNKEGEYIEWLSRNRIRVVVKLVDDEEVRGWIEYFDRDVIRLTRNKESNLFIYRERMKYLFEEREPGRRR